MICDRRTGTIKYKGISDDGTDYCYFNEDGNPSDIKKDPSYRDYKNTLEDGKTAYTYYRKNGDSYITSLRTKYVWQDPLIYNVIAYCDRMFQDGECNSDRKSECDEFLKNDPDISPDTPNAGCKSREKIIQNAVSPDHTSYSYGDCNRMLYHYVCRYTPNYCTELINALNKVLPSLKENYDQFNILSLGCGNAVDLLAFDYLRKINELDPNKKISYLGLDLNKDWTDIQNYTAGLFPEDTIEFNDTVDITTYFSDHKPLEGYNVLIMSYLVSILYLSAKEDAIKQGKDPESYADQEMTKLYDDIIKNIVKVKSNDSPMLIIINDINGFSTYKLFIDELKKAGLQLKGDPQMYRFENARLADNRNNDPQDDFVEIPDDPYDPSEPDDPDPNNPQKYFGFSIYNERGYNTGFPDNPTYQNYYTAMTHPQSYQLILEVE